MARGTPWFVVLPLVLLVLMTLPMWSGLLPMAWWSVVTLSVLAILAVLSVLFFRDPERPIGDGLVAPAHGRVLAVEEEEGLMMVSTFMGPFDVHVVRAPLDGRVVSMERGGSGFRRAYTPEARHNVFLEMAFSGGSGPFTVRLVSGWFARRIVPYLGIGDTVERGSRIGLIRFGSRVDVLVSKGSYRIVVGPGDRVRAGSSRLGVPIDADS